VSRFGTELEVQIASLRRYARALLRDKNDADDLVQESLARALSRADRFKPGTNLRAWLFTIMHNVHVNQVRQKISRPDEVPVEDHEMRLITPARQETSIELRDMSRALAELPDEQRQVLLLVALEGLKYEAELPDEQRQVLLLVALEGLKYDEVAAVLQIPIGTVMSRLSRAREAVRIKLSNEGGVPLRRVK
jgi:RNA polymerase sigma-70 factor, ECF subfamily